MLEVGQTEANKDGATSGLALAPCSGNEPLTTELQEIAKARDIAVLACEERQPMPNEGISNRLIAEMCEEIGEGAANEWRWRDCAHAHRMACWYYRKALAE